MNITPDQIVFWKWEFVVINATLVYTWAVMALMVLLSWAVTRNLTAGPNPGRGQLMLEIVVGYLRDQIRELTRQDPGPYVPFIGTLFLFISVSNLLVIVPIYRPPTGSLSTTAALAIAVFFAVPAYSIAQRGVKDYLKHYVTPSPFMLPFHVIGEISRTIALAIRLFGNIMSGTLAGAILVSIAPLLFPILLDVLGLIIGQVQAYIFAVLATVYIASAVRRQPPEAQGGTPADT